MLAHLVVLCFIVVIKFDMDSCHATPHYAMLNAISR
jgi:hypothetical protein